MEQARGRSICSTMWITGVPILLESVEFREYRFHTGLRTEELWKSSIRTGAITAACAPVLWQSVSPPSVLSAAGAWHQKASVMTSYHELSPSVAHKSRFKSHMLTWCSASRIEIIKRERDDQVIHCCQNNMNHQPCSAPHHPRCTMSDSKETPWGYTTVTEWSTPSILHHHSHTRSEGETLSEQDSLTSFPLKPLLVSEICETFSDPFTFSLPWKLNDRASHVWSHLHAYK